MIKLVDVCKTYNDGTEAVKNLTLEVNEGEFCVFLGPSGCGKTTSLKMINRLIPITSGSIYINDQDVMEQNVNELRRGIGYAIQNIGLFPHLTVEQNIVTVPKLKKWPKAKQHDRAAELLDLVGMDPDRFLKRFPSELSGGQQQRIGVARCLGADPPILLMDEPFGAIDPITRVRLQEEFLKIQGKLKKTIVFVTHDINEAIKMGDTIALMRGGELVQYADPATLLNNPADKFVREFVGADRLLKSLRLHRISEVLEQPKVIVTSNEKPEAVKDRMKKAGVRYAMLTDEQERFVGWISLEDIDTGETLTDISEPPVVTATPDDKLNDALSMMLYSAIGSLAILDDRERILGVVTFDKVRNVLAKEGENAENAETGDTVYETGPGAKTDTEEDNR